MEKRIWSCESHLGLAQAPFPREALAHGLDSESEPGEPDSHGSGHGGERSGKAGVSRMRRLLEGPESQARETSSVTERTPVVLPNGQSPTITWLPRCVPK